MRRVAIALACSLALGACEAAPSVRAVVPRGVPAQRFEIRLETDAPRDAENRRVVTVDAIIVAERAHARSDHVTGRRYWALMRRGEASALELPYTLQYGTAPPGYVADRDAPVFLPPGEYQVEVQAGRAHSITRFDVSNRGVIE